MAASEKTVKVVGDVPTPSFLVDMEKLKNNASKMTGRCETLGVKLRPHMKTHKTREAGTIQTNGTKRSIVVSTLKEAEFYADGGFDDILYGCLITESKLPRCINLANRLEAFHVMLDSSYALKLIQNSPLREGKKWSAVVKVDCGLGRAGFQWDTEEAVSFSRSVAQAKNVTLLGLYTHCGNTYTAKSPDQLQAIEIDTADKLVHLRDRLKAEGIVCPVVGCGSTPTCSRPVDKLSILTELHPGNYIFYDWMQVLLGSCSLNDVACRVATRVVGHYPEKRHMLIDAGFLAIGHEGYQTNIPHPAGFTTFQDHPNLRLFRMTQEVGYVQAIEGELDFDQYPLGFVLYLYPWHSCLTANLHPHFYVHSGEQVVDVWYPTRGW